MKKKVLVTGGTGYIGSHCVIKLIANNFIPIIVDNFCNSYVSVIKNLKKITGQSIQYYNFDLRNYLKLKSVFEKHKFDHVIHFAGLKSVAESSQDPLLYFNNNILSSISLLECMKKNNLFKLIFSSSACVYNAHEPVPWSEDTKVGETTNPYGTSKYIIERILKDLAKSDSRWRIGIARYFNPIGNHSSGIIKDSPNGIPNNLMPYICKVVEGKLPHLNIFGNDYKTKDGTGIRDYIHVEDLADAHVVMLKKFNKIKNFEIFNIGSGKGYSVMEVIKKLETIKKIQIPYEIKKRRKGDIAISVTKKDKIKKILGWKPKYSLTKSLNQLHLK